MSVTVRLPSTLSALAAGRREVPVDGATVDEALAALEEACPGIRARLLAPEGTVRQFICVYVNSQDIRSRDGLATGVRDGDEISIIPALAGG